MQKIERMRVNESVFTLNNIVRAHRTGNKVVITTFHGGHESTSPRTIDLWGEEASVFWECYLCWGKTIWVEESLVNRDHITSFQMVEGGKVLVWLAVDPHSSLLSRGHEALKLWEALTSEPRCLNAGDERLYTKSGGKPGTNETRS